MIRGWPTFTFCVKVGTKRSAVRAFLLQMRGMHSMQDDPDSNSWDGNNVFDVFTKSQDTALDGTKYKDW
jgi:hypothetical protein